MPLTEHELALYRRSAKIERYRRDYERFAREQQYIKTKDAQVVRLELKPAQKLIESVIAGQYRDKGWIRIVEYKARQHGGSTHGVSRACHSAYLSPNVSALILAQDDTTASNLFDMAQLMYEGMDKDIRPVRRYLTKQEIVLENPDVKTRPEYPGLRSQIAIQSAKNIHSGVGTTRNWLHISEQCRFGNVKELMGSLIPAIPLAVNTAIIDESAPFGYGEGRDQFRALCEAARSGKSPFKFVGVYWWMIPEYSLPLDDSVLLNGRFRITTEERRIMKHIEGVSHKELGKAITITPEQLYYRRIRIQELGNGDDTIGEQLFLQQFCTDYESGWITFDMPCFDPYTVQQLKKRCETGPTRRCDYDPNGDRFFDTQGDAPLWIWQDPEPGEVYDIGVDTGSGNGGSYTVAEVFKRSTNEQVAEWSSNKIGVMDSATVMYSLGMYYNAAHLAAEVEGVGYVLNQGLGQKGYPNIYIWRKRDHIGGQGLSTLTGWKTQFDTKKVLVAIMQDQLAHQKITIHSSKVFPEMRKFVQLYTDSGNEQYEASEGNDDHIMACMIAQVARADEIGLDEPMQRGATLERPQTLAERNKRLQEGIAKGPAFMDDEGVEMRDREMHDPWEKFAAAMKNDDHLS